MTANQVIARLESEGVSVRIEGDNLQVEAPPEWWEKLVGGQLVNVQFIRAYKSEILWRLRHLEGDPDASGYSVSVGGERVPLDQLIAEGRTVVGEEKPKTPGLDLDMWAASVALRRREGRG